MLKNLKTILTLEKIKVFLFYALLFILCAAVALKSKNYDFDLWARLIAGMAIVQTGQILKFDFMSYTPTHAWYDHEWGSSVVFYLTQHLFGHLGLLFLQVILIFLTMFFLVKVVKLRGNGEYSPYNILIYFIILNSFMITYASLIRCHSFTFLFFILELYLLELIRKNGNNKLFFIFPFIFLIWGNMHGGVVSGLGLMLMYALGEALNKKQFKYYIISSIVGFLVLFINPYGPEFVGFLLKAVTMPRPDVVEWWSIFHKYNYKLFMTFKLSSLFILIIEFIKIKQQKFSYVSCDKTKFIVMFTTLVFAIAHVKMMPFFVLASTAFAYYDILHIMRNFHYPKWCMKVLVVVLTLYAMVMIIEKDYRPMVNYKTYPVMEMEFIKVNHLEGNILTNFGIGSYAAYKLYPQNKIYMDGRYEEVYDDDLLKYLNAFYSMKKDFNKILKDYTPDIIVLEQGYPIFDILNNSSKKWILAFKGINYGVFVKADKYRDNFIPPNGDIAYYKKTVFNTNIKFKGDNKVDINQVNEKGKKSEQ